MKNWFIRLFKGVVIALGFILPGVSGGVLAAILGIYERMLAFMAHITRDFKRNILFFIPVGIGGALGIGLLSAPLLWLIAHHKVVVLWAFAGAITGTLPSLFKTAAVKSGGKRGAADWALLGGMMLAGFTLLCWIAVKEARLEAAEAQADPAGFMAFMLAGALIALGALVPGLSPSNFLLISGMYSPMLAGFKNFDIMGVYLPVGIGAAATMLLFSKVMDHLVRRHHARVYHAIIGLVIASTALIVLPPVMDYSGAGAQVLCLAAVIFICGFALGAWMEKLEGKYK